MPSIQRIWLGPDWFGTRRSVVQIHSPRPLLLDPTIYGHRDGRGAPGGGQVINVSILFVPHSFALQINALTSGWPVIGSEAPVRTLRGSARPPQRDANYTPGCHRRSFDAEGN